MDERTNATAPPRVALAGGAPDTRPLRPPIATPDPAPPGVTARAIASPRGIMVLCPIGHYLIHYEQDWSGRQNYWNRLAAACTGAGHEDTSSSRKEYSTNE